VTEKLCELCGQPFEAKGKKRFCSKSCCDAASRTRRRPPKPGRPEGWPVIVRRPHVVIVRQRPEITRQQPEPIVRQYPEPLTRQRPDLSRDLF